MAARLMRRVLVDFARARKNQKRGGALHCVTLDQNLLPSSESPEDLVGIDDASRSLDERKGHGGGTAVLRRVERRGKLPRSKLADARSFAEQRFDTPAGLTGAGALLRLRRRIAEHLPNCNLPAFVWDLGLLVGS